MKTIVTRILVVAALQLLLFELVLQFSVHWRESTEELWLMGVTGITFVGCYWAMIPTMRKVNSRLLKALARTGAALAFLWVLSTGNYYYSWHVRPNVGLYREPDWVQNHPGFQRALRQRIEANRWTQAP